MEGHTRGLSAALAANRAQGLRRLCPGPSYTFRFNAGYRRSRNQARPPLSRSYGGVTVSTAALRATCMPRGAGYSRESHPATFNCQRAVRPPRRSVTPAGDQAGVCRSFPSYNERPSLKSVLYHLRTRRTQACRERCVARLLDAGSTPAASTT